MRKIDAPRAWAWMLRNGDFCPPAFAEPDNHDFSEDVEPWPRAIIKRVRIVRETDWRKIMAVIRAAEDAAATCLGDEDRALADALDALNKKEAKG